LVERASAGTVSRHGPVGPIRGFLERFRGVGGVPAAAGDEAAAELAPVFAELDAFELEAAAARAQADRVAAHWRFEAEEGAKEILVAARDGADSERGDALKTGLRAADVEASRIVAAAEADARAIEERGRAALPGLVDEVVARVLEGP
jgi:vacuolar-type H+-ATPase subunit H